MAKQKVAVNDIADDYPAIISPKQFAEILGVTVKTVYCWLAAGRLEGCCRKRGKHVLIHRRKALEATFNGPDWK